MNHEPTVTQYLTKNELYEEFGRHPRTITKDITKAIARGDQELLSLAQLHTKNGRVIEATEVTSNTWKELSDEGENPAWYFSPEFVEIVRQRSAKHRSPRRTSTSTKEVPPADEIQPSSGSKSSGTHSTVGPEPTLPGDPAIKAIVLEHLQYQSFRHATENKDLMDRILKLVKTNQQLQSQTNALFNQFQVALQEGTISNGLTAATRVTPQPTDPTSKEETPEAVIVVDEDETTSVELKSTVTKRKTKPKAEKVVKQVRAKPATKKKAAKKKTPAKRKAAKIVEAPKKRSGIFGRFFGNTD